MIKIKCYREESRKNWGTKDINLNNEQINCGSLLRIADATEAMAKNFIELQRQKEDYQRWYNEEREENKKLRSSNYHLKGYITKLKRNLSKTI